MRILVVDDSPDSLMLTRIELEQRGHVVHTAEDGSTALRIVLEDPPDLVISDIRLPEMDGFDLVRRMRANPRLRPIPAIAVTGVSTPAEIKQIREVGFGGCLIKPVDFERLVAEIERVVKLQALSSGRPK